FRRSHPDSHTYGDQSRDKLLEFFHPRLKERIVLPRWRRLFENFVSVKRAPIKIHEKANLFVYLTRQAIRGKNDYITDLQLAIKQFLDKFYKSRREDNR
ncbi:MAG: hypothetical protein O7D34_10645, partial [Ignavibacteria bacterium]|nr:hypothetical protein [Ignavibacteria bacterium]